MAKKQKQVPQPQPKIATQEKAVASTSTIATELPKNNLAQYYIFGLLAVVAAVYFKVTQFDIVNWDDEMYISLNQNIRSLSMDSIKNMLVLAILAKHFMAVTIILWWR